MEALRTLPIGAGLQILEQSIGSGFAAARRGLILSSDFAGHFICVQLKENNLAADDSLLPLPTTVCPFLVNRNFDLRHYQFTMPGDLALRNGSCWRYADCMSLFVNLLLEFLFLSPDDETVPLPSTGHRTLPTGEV